MASRANLLAISGFRFELNIFWPTVPAGFYDFTDGVERFSARNAIGDLALDLGAVPNDNDSYFLIGTVDWTAANGLLIPAGSWIGLYISAIDTAALATQMLQWIMGFQPPTADPLVFEEPLALVEGSLIFTASGLGLPELVAL